MRKQLLLAKKMREKANSRKRRSSGRTRGARDESASHAQFLRKPRKTATPSLHLPLIILLSSWDHPGWQRKLCRTLEVFVLFELGLWSSQRAGRKVHRRSTFEGRKVVVNLCLFVFLDLHAYETMEKKKKSERGVIRKKGAGSTMPRQLSLACHLCECWIRLGGAAEPSHAAAADLPPGAEVKWGP